MIDLSVVIPTFRKPGLLARTLDALEDQHLEAAWEVVVVDDGSQDQTTDVLRHFSSRLPLVVRCPPQNEGRAKARNRGWRAARGRSVLFLDDDIVLEPGSLASHHAAQRRHAAAYLAEVRTAPEVIDSTLFEYLDTRGVAKHAPGTRVPARYFLTQNVSVPRDALERAGGFDEDFGAYGFEDMEVAFRLEQQSGLEFYSLEGAVGYHIHHHSLDEYLDKKQICGRETLPVLARLHPERMGEMRLDLLDPLPLPDSAKARALRRALRLSFGAGLPGLVKSAVSTWPSGLAPGLRHRAYDYLVMAAYSQGLRQS